MANTYTALHYHIVFSTKNREPWLTAENEERIWKYLGGIARDKGLMALQVGGCCNHVHVLLSMPPTIAVSKAVQLLKGASSHWIHETFKDLSAFAWQDGYGALWSVCRRFRTQKDILRTSGNTIRKRLSRKNTSLFCANMVWNTMNDMCGDNVVAVATRRIIIMKLSQPGNEFPGYNRNVPTGRKTFAVLFGVARN